jgi:hypothetical protein
VAGAAGFVETGCYDETPADLTTWMAAEQEVSLFHRETGLKLDLHWRQGPRFADDSLLAADLFDRSQSVLVLGRRLLAPGRTDVVLTHVLHATVHEWSRLEYVAVMVAALRGIESHGVDDLLRMARLHDCRRRLSVGVLLASAVGGADVPAALMAEAARDAVARKLAAEIGALLLCAGLRERSAVWSQRRGAFWQARTLDNRHATMRHLRQRLFTPGERDWGATGSASPGSRLEALRLQLRRQQRLWLAR